MKSGFIQIPDELSARVDLTPSHKLIMGILARLQGDNATAFPSHDYLAKSSGLSRRQVIRVVNDLATRKEIVRLRIPYQSNSYRVPFATQKAMRKKWATTKAKKSA